MKAAAYFAELKVGLEEMGIKAYMPTPDLSNRSKFYPPNLFRYDREKDRYICPEGKSIPLFSRRKTEQVLVNRAKTKVCNDCPVKAKCTDSKSGRYIFRSFFQEHLDRAEAYQKAMRKQGVWVEPLFGEAKQFHQLRRFRLRGLKKVNIKGVMIAAGQNIKRLIKDRCIDFLRYADSVIYSSPLFSLLFQQTA